MDPAQARPSEAPASAIRSSPVRREIDGVFVPVDDVVFALDECPGNGEHFGQKVLFLLRPLPAAPR